MSATATIAIPFERQSDPETQRDCGAACLSMVYRSLGQDVPRAELWPAIAKHNRFGSLASTTHLMTSDALNRGFSAVALQARHPLQALRLCLDSGIRAILNLRPQNNTPTGHYAVLVDLDGRDVVLHDPYYGPARRMPHADLLELWQPRASNSEIAGCVLIGIALEPASIASCWLCQTPMPSAAECPKCRKPVGLQPNALLGCASTDCIARVWNAICCPSCDNLFGFSLQSPLAEGAVSSLPSLAAQPAPSGAPSPGAQPANAAKEDPLDLSRVFAEIDKFCNLVLTVPGAAEHPEVKKQLDFIATSKEKLKLAQAEAKVHQKVHQEQLAKFVQTAKENEEAHRKKLEELNRPSPPLDGNALGRSLLKSLGFAA